MILLLMGILCVVLLAAALVVVMIQESQKGNESSGSALSKIQTPSNSEFDDFESEKQVAFPFVGMSGNPTDGMITIDWHFPSKNALTTYKIEVQSKSSVWYEASECDGSLEEVAAANFCKIPLSTLQKAPFFLSIGDAVKARVFIIDEEGWISTQPTSIEDGRSIIIEVPELVTESLIFGNLKGNQPHTTKSWMAPM